MSDIPWVEGDPPIVFSAAQGDEQLHVQVVGGQTHPDPAKMYVLLEVRLRAVPTPG